MHPSEAATQLRLAACRRAISQIIMIKTLKDVLRLAEAWPKEDQEELAEYAREIVARRTGV
jgi:hypothetical protein